MPVPLSRLYDLVPAAELLDLRALDPAAAEQQSLFPDLPADDGLDEAGEPLVADPPTLSQAEAVVRRVLGLPPA